VEIISRSLSKERAVLYITIFEGRNREVRKMMEYFNCKVIHLARIRYGFLELGNLHMGEYRRLRRYEVKKLMRLVQSDPSSSSI